MIVVKGTKWEFKKINEECYEVRPLTKGEDLAPFTYYPQGGFRCKKLKRNIRKRLERKNKEDHQ